MENKWKVSQKELHNATDDEIDNSIKTTIANIASDIIQYGNNNPNKKDACLYLSNSLLRCNPFDKEKINTLLSKWDSLVESWKQ